MDPRIKRKWIETLRSGDYLQGHHGLKRIDQDGPEYCCLGVLCEIYRIEKRRSRWISIANGWFKFKGEASVLPKAVREWAGMEDECGTFSPKRRPEDSLASANDSGKSFKQIARIIEKYF